MDERDSDSRSSLGRRQFIAGSASLAAAGMLGPLYAQRRAAAQRAAPARNLIVVLQSGGWDTTYALDPKPGSTLVDTPDGDLTRFGELSVLTHAERPAVAQFFERYGERTALVNGLQVRSFVHPDCLKRMLTGSPSETTPDMAAIAAHELGRDLPVPYLALGGQARSGPYAAITGRTGTTNQLSALLDARSAYPAEGGVGPEIGLTPSQHEAGLVRSYLDVTSSRLREGRAARGQNRARIDDYQSSLERGERLRAFVRDAGLGARDYTLDLKVQIPLTVRALKGGLAATALLQTNNWDTHQNNARQGALHQQLFAALSLLIETLEREAMLDHTLVVALSEMGRTPKLNADAGKDHWPVTSALLIGAGVRGGRTLGGTDEQLGALSIDLETGTPMTGGKQLQAANFVSGVLTTLGVDPEPYLPQIEPFRAFMA
jgi:Protein of unknown function (DUF1501)